MCREYRKVNNCTKTDTFPIIRIDDCTDKIEQSKFVSKFDLIKRFLQFQLTEKAKEMSAFLIPNGLLQYKVMPFGIKNSPCTFQHLVNKAISGLDGVGTYVDDVIIYSNAKEEHLRLI